MDMNPFRPPNLHVAQQSRREKLRIHHDLLPTVHHSGGIYINTLEHDLPPQGLNYEYCTEMLNFGGNRDAGDDLMLDQESDDKRTVINEAQSFQNFSRTIPTPGDPHYFSTWKSIGSQSTTDNWVADSQIPNFFGDSSLKDVTGLQELHSQSNNAPLYQNALQELVTSSNVQVKPFPLELASIRQKSTEETSRRGHHWGVDGGNGLPLHPAYTTTTNHPLRVRSCDLISRSSDAPPDWRGSELGCVSTAHVLSLSLSSVPLPKVHATQIAKKGSTTNFQSIQDSRDLLSGGLQGSTQRNLRPLGPFTGYETILRGSKYLRPSQHLLDELCFVRSKNDGICEVTDKAHEEAVRVSNKGVDIVDLGGKAIGEPGGGGSSSLTFDGFNDRKGGEPIGLNCSSMDPEILQKKAKLLYMQDEVCKWYRHYQQQMQMVSSSFESVAGLSGATPNVSLALRMVSKHFRCLKNVISNQLKSIRNALGEDMSPPTIGKGDGVSMLRFFDQSLQKQQKGTDRFLDGQHIWRPQRGLPEPAVSILRSWLFDHFLHPYPTDTDKHMLANQTGLTRNQVSNWFINARVRVWKPMVEEIHMLKTKGMAQTRLDTEKQAAAAPTTEGCHQSNNATTESLNMLGMSTIPNKQQQRVGGTGTSWNDHESSRVGYPVPSSVGSNSLMMGLVPSVELGGLGAVSLTLGLRQGADNNSQRLPLQQDQHHPRLHFGGTIMQDFVG